MERKLSKITGYSTIDGVVPGIKGQRAFPNKELSFMDPFIMLDHIGPQEVSKDFFIDGSQSGHPHRGFETITFLFEGKMLHKDSIGNKVWLDSGAVQRMNAGSGIQHGGDFQADPDKKHFHEIQLWMNVASHEKMSTPEIENATPNDIPVVSISDQQIRVISGEFKNHVGPIQTKADTRILHLLAKANNDIVIDEIPADHQLMVYAMSGSFRIQDQMVNHYHTARFVGDGNEIEIATEQDGELLIASGKPISESIVMGGPFVMNTTEEIDQAYIDFKAGKFGNL